MMAVRNTLRAGLLAAAALVVGCGDGDGGAEDSGVDAATDTGADATDAGADTAADVAPDACEGSGASCGDTGSDVTDTAVDPDVPVGVCGPIEPVVTWVVTELRFARETSGVSNGFDVDGQTSTGADPVGCRKPDFTSPDGTPGVDNQFARLLPAIEAAGGAALEGLIQAAINEGDILIMLEVESFDGASDDTCVSAVLQRGSGIPILDANSRIEGGQTFARDATVTQSRADGVTVEDGVLEFGPVSFVVPAYVFFYEFLFPIESGSVRMVIRDDGTASGVMGGGISLDYLIETASGIDGAGDAPDALITLAPGLADLFPDESGQCQAVSAALEFEAVPAFFYE